MLDSMGIAISSLPVHRNEIRRKQPKTRTMTYNILFKYCVHLLQHWGKLVHMSYEEINIWIFVIIEPMVFLIMLLTIIYQFSKISVKDNRIGYAQALTDCQDFAEWCSMNGWVYVDFKVMWVNPKSGLEPSTTNLFALFIQEKSKTKEQ